MTKVLKVAVSGGDTLFRKGLEFIINSYDDLDTILLAEDLSQLFNQLSHRKLFPDVLLHDIGIQEPFSVHAEILQHKGFSVGPMILLTSKFDETKLFQSIDLGIASYLPKDIDPDEIAFILRQVDKYGAYFKSYPNTKPEAYASYPQPLDLSHISFTKREMEVLQFICEQYTTSEIAEELYISPRTVDGHRNNLLEKTSSKNTAGLVVFALKHQIVDPKNQRRS